MSIAQERYERAVWELSRAQTEHDEAKHALEAENYAKGEAASAHDTGGEDTSDLG